MRTTLILALVFFVGACAQEVEQTNVPEPNVVGVSYGEEVTLTERTEIAEILASPETFLGERVLVQGTVVEVCTGMGCWMDITTDNESEKIQIKVEDGVIVFPVSARGKKALVEGVVESVDQTAEQAYDYAKHMAEDKGVAFDSTATFEGGKTYRIRGKGAVIAE